ncbi:MAG: MATE family efflux transporter [Bacillota bacterium]|jgi:putative MATE family efflux protein
MNRDMTKGDILRALAYFTIPLILSGLLQQCYHIADSLIVGNLLGEHALAAVGVSAPVLNVFIFVVTGLVSGYMILLSQYVGGKEDAKASRLSNTFFLFVLACAGLAAIAGFGLKGSILAALNTPAELLEPASGYLSIVFLGVPFLVLYNLYSSMLRAIGDSRTPLYSIIVSTIINVVLNVIFTQLLDWGIKGVAVATVVAQLFSSLFLLLFVHRHHPVFRLSFRRETLDLALLWECIRLGIPRIIQSSISSVGSLLLQNIRNSFGLDVVTAITTAYKIDSLTILPLVNISVAISVFVGQNVGANNLTRAREGLKRGIAMSLLVAVSITTVVVTFGGLFMQAFGVSDDVAALGQRFFRILALFYPILGLWNALAGFLQGNKDVAFTSFTHIGALAIRVFLSYALASRLGSDVIATSELCSWLVGASLCWLRYRSNRWLKLAPGVGQATEAVL